MAFLLSVNHAQEPIQRRKKPAKEGQEPQQEWRKGKEQVGIFALFNMFLPRVRELW